MRRRQTGEIDPMSFGGRYTLTKRLAVGGMAEIYLAKQAPIWRGQDSLLPPGAVAGFEKEVVIKRLRQELADDPRIVEMFLDEAKIGAQLNHPNIVHVYDVDEHDGIPYIAMEFIIGEELNELCRRGLQVGRFLPLEHAVELMRQAATGMGYFHAKRGALAGRSSENEPLEIVHLDISPSNLLVTQDGYLKVIDFGIARAKGQHGRNDVLPGKLSYMSPEQAARKPVDHRSDIFSLGIVLYEITVGRRLFRGPAQEVVKRLVDGTVEPPTFARRNFPPALESIVMRTLEKHPDDRYQTAYDLADDLESFLRDEKLHSGPVRIARYLDMLAVSSGGTRRAELISESETRQGGENELDFDSQVFEGYKPTEGAPGPEQAPLWEDVEQNEADVAAALHMELAELRALRTPVPARPSGMMAIAVPSQLGLSTGASADDDDPVVTSPVRRMKTGEIFGDDDEADASMQADDEDDIAVTARRPAPAARPKTPTPVPVAPVANAPFQVATTIPQIPSTPIPTVGAALLARATPSRLPWVLVGALGVAVLGLVAYIVMR